MIQILQKKVFSYNIYVNFPPIWVIESLYLTIKALISKILVVDIYPLSNPVQPLIYVRLFATPWSAACKASLSITNSQSLLKLMSIKSVMPSNNLILSSSSPPAFNLSQHQGLFQWVSSLHQVAKVLEFQLQHQFF